MNKHAQPSTFQQGALSAQFDDFRDLPIFAEIQKTAHFNSMITNRVGAAMRSQGIEINSERALILWKIDRYLAKHQEMVAGDLVKRGLYQGTNAAYHMHALFKEGYISLMADPKDQRRKKVALTELGVRVAHFVKVEMLDIETGLKEAQNLSKEESNTRSLLQIAVFDDTLAMRGSSTHDFPVMGYLRASLNLYAVVEDRIEAALKTRHFNDLMAPNGMLLWHMSMHVQEHGSMRASDLIDRQYYRGTNVTYALSSLEETGYITRMENPADKRSMILTLTDKGQAAAAVVHDQLQEMETHIPANIPALGLDKLADMTRTVNAVNRFARYPMIGLPKNNSGQ